MWVIGVSGLFMVLIFGVTFWYVKYRTEAGNSKDEDEDEDNNYPLW